MGLILSLETATKMCSVSLGHDGKELVTLSHFSEKYSHAERLNHLITELLEKADYTLNDLDAIAVSEGPGSYTGLRIGTSTAKGLCYALDIPMIAVNSLKAVAASKIGLNMMICPMFDARRMEVYSAIYDAGMNELDGVKAVVVENDSYNQFLEEGKVCFMGPGAEKCQEVLTHENAVFDTETRVSAKGMISLAEEKFGKNDFVDLAYFEPYYLKDFIAGAPKKLL